MHLEHLVDGLHVGARACCHALLALGVHQFGTLAFLRRHRADDRVHAQQHAVVHARLLHRRLGLLHARHHASERAEAAHALHLLELHAQIVEVELPLRHLPGEGFGLFFLDRRRGLFDQADHVAHA